MRKIALKTQLELIILKSCLLQYFNAKYFEESLVDKFSPIDNVRRTFISLET